MRPGFRKKRGEQTPGQKSNRTILRLTYVVVFLFVVMIGYEGHFLTVRREDTINNAYNARLNTFSDRVLRGQILSDDGTVLARTLTEEDGTEIRQYPFGGLFAHVVGYTSKGKTGLEALGNFYMLTSHVNLLEQVVTELSGEKNPGDNVYTTLDVGLQQAASAALGDQNGAVVVLEPDTGKILALVSKPGFDPNTVAQDWEALTEEEGGQARLLNRACQGLYPPGSIFKLVTALEYMRECPDSFSQYEFDCDGRFEAGDYTIQCYHKTAHGKVDLESAFANSCNGAFANLGLELDLGRLAGTAEELLYNRELPLSLAYNKSSYTMAEGADAWEVLQTAIGQGKTQITPMHSAMITAAVANGGILMKPYLIDHVEQAGKETVKQFSPTVYGSLMTAEESAALAAMMRTVVTEGTGSAVRTDAYTAAGKTGSAEFVTGKETHAWFTGFAPLEDPRLVVSVIVEEGGSGGQSAAPVARAVFDEYFLRQG